MERVPKIKFKTGLFPMHYPTIFVFYRIDSKPFQIMPPTALFIFKILTFLALKETCSPLGETGSED